MGREKNGLFVKVKIDNVEKIYDGRKGKMVSLKRRQPGH